MDRQDLTNSSTVSRRLLSGAAWLTASSGTVTALTVLQGVLAARALGAEDYGVIGLSVAFVMIVRKILSFRMSEFVVKYVGDLCVRGDVRLASAALRLAFVAEAASCLLAFVVVRVFAVWAAAVFVKDPLGVAAISQLAWLAALSAVTESSTGVLQVGRKYKSVGAIALVSQAVALAAVALAYARGWGAEGVVFSFILAEAVRGALSAAAAARHANLMLGSRWFTVRGSAPADHLRGMARFAVLSNLGGTLTSGAREADLLLLGMLRNPTEAAYFKLAMSMSQLVVLPTSQMVNTLYPEVVKYVAQGAWERLRKLCWTVSRAAVVWMLLSWAVAASLAVPAVRLLYGSAFVPAAWALYVLMIGLSVDAVLLWDRGLLLALDRPGLLVRLNAALAAVKLILAVVLIPFGGYLMLAALQNIPLVVGNLAAARIGLREIRSRSGRRKPFDASDSDAAAAATDGSIS